MTVIGKEWNPCKGEISVAGGEAPGIRDAPCGWEALKGRDIGIFCFWRYKRELGNYGTHGIFVIVGQRPRRTRKAVDNRPKGALEYR